MKTLKFFNLLAIMLTIISISSCKSIYAPTPISTVPASLTPTELIAGVTETVISPSIPIQNLEFSNLSDLTKATKLQIWIPTNIPDNLPFYKAWITDYANGNQNVRLLFAKPGISLDANSKSLDMQVMVTDEIVSRNSITHQFKVIALDVKEVQVRGQTGFTYWTKSVAAGNSAFLVWREGTVNFSLSLFGNWPPPDESNTHGLDNMLLMIAKALHTLQ
jgi:hypothetical protein